MPDTQQFIQMQSEAEAITRNAELPYTGNRFGDGVFEAAVNGDEDDVFFMGCRQAEKSRLLVSANPFSVKNGSSVRACLLGGGNDRAGMAPFNYGDHQSMIQIHRFQPHLF